MKILIVEQDRASAISLRRDLEQIGHEVALTEDGIGGWRRLQSEQFALVIAAWYLPDVGGQEIARRLRARGDNGAYIILLSSGDSRENRANALSTGTDDFLNSPHDRDDLHARILVAERILSLRARIEGLEQEIACTKDQLERITQIDQKNIEDIRATCRDLEMAHVHLHAKATTDSLTGLNNHLEFQERVEDEISRASRYHLPLSLIMLDVDHFKSFNDSFGHPAGDAALRRIAQVLTGHARETDILARYGGEEFAIILPNTDHEHAVAAADRFRLAIAAEPWEHSAITVSIGISTLRILPQTRAALISEADLALYSCKSCGRNCVAHYADIREPV